MESLACSHSCCLCQKVMQENDPKHGVCARPPVVPGSKTVGQTCRCSFSFYGSLCQCSVMMRMNVTNVGKKTAISKSD